jgi:hypothetical protein
MSCKILALRIAPIRARAGYVIVDGLGITMKLYRSMFVALAFASATAIAAPQRQAPAEVTPSEASRWMALFDRVVDTVVVNREDCPKMASSLDAVVDANQDTIAMARDAKAKGKRLPPSTMQRMQDGARRMLAALDKCGRDEKVGAAFRRIDLGARK